MEFFCTCNSLPVHVSDTKTGDKTIVLLHGYLETLYIWEEFTALLSHSYRVIAIDLPGHGLTGSYEVNSMEKCAAVVKSVLDILGVTRAVFAGHSMGGYVAVEVAKMYPSLFEALIMINSTPFADAPEKIDDRRREIEIIKQNKIHTLVKLAVSNMFAKANLSRMEEKIVEIAEIAEVHDPEGIAASLVGLINRADNTKFLSTLKIPLAFIFGEHDNYISAEKREIIMSSTPIAAYFVFSQSGHNSFIEEPQKCAETVIDFVNSL